MQKFFIAVFMSVSMLSFERCFADDVPPIVPLSEAQAYAIACPFVESTDNAALSYVAYRDGSQSNGILNKFKDVEFATHKDVSKAVEGLSMDAICQQALAFYGANGIKYKNLLQLKSADKITKIKKQRDDLIASGASKLFVETYVRIVTSLKLCKGFMLDPLTFGRALYDNGLSILDVSKGGKYDSVVAAFKKENADEWSDKDSIEDSCKSIMNFHGAEWNANAYIKVKH